MMMRVRAGVMMRMRVRVMRMRVAGASSIVSMYPAARAVAAAVMNPIVIVVLLPLHLPLQQWASCWTSSQRP